MKDQNIEIRIDREALSAVVAEAVLAGVRRGSTDYEMQQRIAAVARDALTKVDLVGLVAEQLERVLPAESARMAEDLGREVVPVFLAAVRLLWRTTVADLVVDVSSRGRYLEAQERTRLRDDAMARMAAAGAAGSPAPTATGKEEAGE